MKNYNVANMSRHEVAAYVDKEALPFIRINEKAVAAGHNPPFLNPKAEAIRYELVTREDGSIVKHERSKPLLAEVGEVSNQWLCDVRTTKTDSEKVLAKTKSGKYNDEHRMEGMTPCSVEVGEIESFRTME